MGLTRIRAEQISDIDYKQAVRVITLTDITLSGGAPAEVDGVSLTAGDRILVAGQSNAAQNGLYQVQTVGAGSNGTWVRTTDANQTGEIFPGMIVMVTEGSQWGDTQWLLVTNGDIIIGTTELEFQRNVGGKVSVSGSPPSNPKQGDYWIDSDTAIQYIYFSDGNSSQWAEMEAQVSFSSGGGGSADFTSISSNVLPSANVTYNLGSSDKRWNDLWLANSTIHLGEVSISAAGGNLELPATVQIGNVTLSESGGNLELPENISANILTATATTTSNLTVNNNNISADNSLGFRNRIINGAMMIDQRNAGASVTAVNNTYCLDRWQLYSGAASKFSVQQVSDAPSGFSFSLKVTSLSAYSVGASESFNINQFIEGFNTADLAFGTASAKTITLSFWAKSSLTGTFGGAVNNASYGRSYPFTYEISVADTWEYKTVTIAGDTSGTWVGATNGIGVIVSFGIGNGTSVSGTGGAWASATYTNATGATSVVGTNAATWYITGVQLEVGSVATPFERRPYGTELQLCQRYYYKAFTSNLGAFGIGFCVNTTVAAVFTQFPVSLRTRPTALEQSGTAADYEVAFAATLVTASVVPAYSANTNEIYAQTSITVASGLTAGNAAIVRARNTNAYLAWSAEL